MEKNNKTKESKKEQPKETGDAKGKASFDQNGEGSSPKYAQAGKDPSETKEGTKKGKL